MKGQRILRAGRPAYVRKESQGVLVIRATANKSLTSVLSGGLCGADGLSSLAVTQRFLKLTHSYSSCRHMDNITKPLLLKHVLSYDVLAQSVLNAVNIFSYHSTLSNYYS